MKLEDIIRVMADLAFIGMVIMMIMAEDVDEILKMGFCSVLILMLIFEQMTND